VRRGKEVAVTVRWDFETDRDPSSMFPPEGPDAERGRDRGRALVLTVAMVVVVGGSLWLVWLAVNGHRVRQELSREVGPAVAVEEQALAGRDRGLYLQMQDGPRAGAADREFGEASAPWHPRWLLPGWAPEGEGSAVAVEPVGTGDVRLARVTIRHVVTDLVTSGVFAENRLYANREGRGWVHTDPTPTATPGGGTPPPRLPALRAVTRGLVAARMYPGDAPVIEAAVAAAADAVAAFSTTFGCAGMTGPLVRLTFTGDVASGVDRTEIDGASGWQLPAIEGAVMPVDDAARAMITRGVASLAVHEVADRWLARASALDAPLKLDTTTGPGITADLWSALVDRWLVEAGLLPAPRALSTAEVTASLQKGSVTSAWDLWGRQLTASSTLTRGWTTAPDRLRLARSFLDAVAERAGHPIASTLIAGAARQRPFVGWIGTALGSDAPGVVLDWPRPPGDPPAAFTAAVASSIVQEVFVVRGGAPLLSVAHAACDGGDPWLTYWRPDGAGLAVVCLARPPAAPGEPVRSGTAASDWQVSVRFLDLAGSAAPVVLWTSSGLPGADAWAYGGWSPDGRWFMWSAIDASEAGSGTADRGVARAGRYFLAEVGATRGGPRQDARRLDAVVPDETQTVGALHWSPAGGMVAYDVVAGDRAQVAILDPVSGDRASYLDGTGASWSPDGTHLAVIRGDRAGRPVLAVLDPATGVTRSDTEIPLPDGWPGWSAVPWSDGRPRTRLGAWTWSRDGRWVSWFGTARGADLGERSVVFGAVDVTSGRVRQAVPTWYTRRPDDWSAALDASFNVPVADRPWLGGSSLLSLGPVVETSQTNAVPPREVQQWRVLDVASGEAREVPVRDVALSDLSPDGRWRVRNVVRPERSGSPSGNLDPRAAAPFGSLEVVSAATGETVWVLPMPGVWGVDWAPTKPTVRPSARP
jgi:hypothetical protein